MTILEIKNISKKFRINHELVPYLSLREKLMETFKGHRLQRTEEFWALDDVSFSVEEGESIGIIGRNGAGKSTLLKILSKITPPTKGKIISRGRIASLLEVGTGFHAELSGRENIFLNGSILGMKRKEVMQKFDEIVDFSGVEKFLDTPLKHYSNGMQLRLAFAVAAFLEPEILVIDEVLAVGDSEFQKKCIGKMDEVSKSGRTILFVSHQMGSVAQLCQKAILLKNGKIITTGPTDSVIDKYLQVDNMSSNEYFCEQSHKTMYFRKVGTTDDEGNPCDQFGFDNHINIRLEISINTFIRSTQLAVALLNKFQSRVFTLFKPLDSYLNPDNSEANSKSIVISLRLPAELIAPNSYSFFFGLFIPSVKSFDLLENVCSIKVIDTGTDYAQFEGVDYGSIIMNDAQWK